MIIQRSLLSATDVRWSRFAAYRFGHSVRHCYGR